MVFEGVRVGVRVTVGVREMVKLGMINNVLVAIGVAVSRVAVGIATDVDTMALVGVQVGGKMIGVDVLVKVAPEP